MHCILTCIKYSIDIYTDIYNYTTNFTHAMHNPGYGLLENFRYSQFIFQITNSMVYKYSLPFGILKG
ncbi:MAG: hypothetical protein ACI86M_001740 [Saprospiraceae bacterium]|jgi:hypothetical protein